MNTANKMSVKDIDVAGKKVLVRCDGDFLGGHTEIRGHFLNTILHKTHTIKRTSKM